MARAMEAMAFLKLLTLLPYSQRYSTMAQKNAK